MTSDTETLGIFVDFARRLRASGVGIGTSQIARYAEGIAAVDPSDVRDLYWAGRACLLTRPDDVSAYDMVFADWFLSGALDQVGLVARGAPRAADDFVFESVAASRAATGNQEPEEERDGVAGAIASEIEVLRHKDFAACTPADLDRVRALMLDIASAPPTRRSRRNRPTPQGRHVDMPRTLRSAARRGGVHGPIKWRGRRMEHRPLVLLLDVSGSMAGYSRALLQFAHSAVRGRDGVEVFAFGTRVTRISDALGRRDPDAALEEAAGRVVDWAGGTLIGDSVAGYIERWGRRAGFRGAVVLICSDGLERGDPVRLGDAMARLSRLARTVIWVNPLKGDAAFEPATRGMQAALPHIDELVSGHDLASLEHLADLVRALR